MTAVISSSLIRSDASAWELNPITEKLVQSLQPSVAARGNHLINDIAEDICVDANRELLATVLAGLIGTVNHQVSGSNIRLTAKQYSDVILVHLKDYNNTGNLVVDKKIQALAEKMGGFVGVSSQRNNLTTIAFCFPNLPMEAGVPEENTLAAA